MLFAIAATVTSCALVVSFDDYGRGHGRADAAVHGIAGTVDGLRGATVTLRVGAIVLEVGDGPFLIQAGVPEGAPYAVTVVAVPKGHACTVESGAGVIEGSDVHGVLVHCPSNIATLSTLSVSAAALSPPFQPGTLDYAALSTASLVAASAPTSTTVTASTLDDRARITIDGVSVPSGATSTVISLSTVPKVVDVSVTAADGRTQAHYTVVVSLRGIDYVKASNPQPSAFFGGAIAVSGSTLVIGAHDESSPASGVNGDQSDASAPGAGAVYVFTRTGATWAQQAYLKASNTRVAGGSSNNALFGAAVALSGDTLVVGAPREKSTATGIGGDQSQSDGNVESGAAYVFTRTGSTWSQQAYLKPSNNGVGQGAFGRAVSISGDTIAVGARLESSCASGTDGDQTLLSGGLPACPNAGAVYVFTRAGATWSQQAYLKASNPRGAQAGIGAFFGTSVAVSNDRLAIGSSGESSNARGIDADQSNTASRGSGAVYVFVRSGATWTQEAYIKPANTLADAATPTSTNLPRAYAGFGTSVALSADTLAVAAPGDSSRSSGVGGDPYDDTLNNAGAVFVFRRAGKTWSQEAYVKATNNGWMVGAGFPVPGPRDWTDGPRFSGAGIADLGGGLALDGDMLAVGAFYESSGAAGILQKAPAVVPIGAGPPPDSIPGAGAVYLFRRTGTLWKPQEYVKAPLPRSSSWFGGTVALDPDGRLFVGAEGESSSASGVNGDQTDLSMPYAGAVYVY
jgi:hypothetical protein